MGKERKMFNQNRLVCADVVRALSMLIIIGFCHLQDYFAVGAIYNSTIWLSRMVGGSLSAFAFISGYFLGKKEVHSFSDVKLFYKKRFLRIYPLFFLSCTSFLLLDIIFNLSFLSGVKQYVLTLLGIAVFTGDSPRTIWFVSMLLLFYAFTPLFLSCKIKVRAIILCLIFSLLFILSFFINQIDYRVVYLFAFYGAGLLFQNIELDSKIRIPLLLIGIVAFVGFSILDLKVSVYIFDYLYKIAFVVTVFEFGKIIQKSHIISKIFVWISYASMVAYLFHRQYFSCIHKITGNFEIVISYLLYLPLLLVISFFIQRSYDKLIDIFSKKINKEKQVEHEAGE